MKHTIKHPIKHRYFYGIDHVECNCGKWRVNDELPCWNSGERKQMMSESFAELNQAIRNLGYEILKQLRLAK